MNLIKIELSEEDINRCWNFANNIIRTSNQYDRMNAKNLTNDEKLLYRIKRTFVGKLGEMAFKNLLESRKITVDAQGMFEIYRGAENVDSFDFLTQNNETIDIKTAVFPNHIRLVVPIDQFLSIPKTYYVGVKLELQHNVSNYLTLEKKSIKNVYICGYVSHDELNRKDTINLREFSCKSINLEYLHDIEELLKILQKSE